MKVALDTNAYADLARGDKAVAAAVNSAETVVIPFIVLAELRSGFTAGDKSAQNLQHLNYILSQPQVEVVYADERTVEHYTIVYRDLRSRGKMIPTNDLWIAAIVTQHGLALCTRDSHFDHLPQIQRV